MKLPELRGILQYVTHFRDKIFVVAIDGEILGSENFANILLDIAVLRSLSIKVVLVHGAGLQIEQAAQEQGIRPTNPDGIGLVVTRDGAVIRMRPGDTVWTPPGEEHWHGATAGHMMCHYAMLEGDGTGDGTSWLEPVNDDQYQTANER